MEEKARVLARDRRRYVVWLREARKRFGLSILDYTVTSNHIHLLVAENEKSEAISKTMQLIAGRVGQEYNQRKGRNGRKALTQEMKISQKKSKIA